MGRLPDSFGTGRPDPTSGVYLCVVIDALMRVYLDVHYWYRVVYVCWLVLGITASVGSGLILRTGTARGDLGRHATLAPDGSLVFTHRLEVFQQARSFSSLSRMLHI